VKIERLAVSRPPLDNPSCMARERHEGGERWFFLDPAAPEGAPRLLPDDERHALKVLRLEPGACIVALDGAGSTWDLELADVRRGEALWRLRGELASEPEPGAPGSALPWLEVAVAPPKGARADELVERLVQLGVAAVVLLGAERTQGYAREQVGERLERWNRLAREQCKQCRRLWLPDLSGPVDLATHLRERPARAQFWLDPRAATPLAAQVAERSEGTRAAPLRLWIGPEGGWSPAEEELFRTAGVPSAALVPHVLRVETAAEAAAAIALHAAWRRG
jgi:16S rRNA (uracil1498-N3)-methyltransferase